eukprot:g67082.t1
MSTFDYVSLDGRVTNDTPVQPSITRNPLRIAAVLASALLAGLAGPGLLRFVGPHSERQQQRSGQSKELPAQELERVLIRPGPSGLLALPVPARPEQPLCLFSYGKFLLHDELSKGFAAGAQIKDAKLYGVRLDAYRGYAQPTGLSSDVLPGRLLCWSSPIAVANKLGVQDRRHGLSDPSNPKDPLVHRGAVWAVQTSGRTRAWLYYQQRVVRQSLEHWLEPLEKALRMEAKRGYNNMQGREEVFSAFIYRSLTDQTAPLSQEQRRSLSFITQQFQDYGLLSPLARKLFVQDLQTRLQTIREQRRPVRTLPDPPRLHIRPIDCPAPTDQDKSGSGQDQDTSKDGGGPVEAAKSSGHRSASQPVQDSSVGPGHPVFAAPAVSLPSTGAEPSPQKIPGPAQSPAAAKGRGRTITTAAPKAKRTAARVVEGPPKRAKASSSKPPPELVLKPAALTSLARAGKSAGSNQQPAASSVIVKGGGRVDPATSVRAVMGVGLVNAERLEALGLTTARDLLLHYPRDYIDYANLVRIADLEPGTTATIVARLRSTSAFRSPKNSNLGILSLTLDDPTGSIRVSQFFAGRRFASMAFLKGQEARYPVGCSVAVSGLVKDGPFGPDFGGDALIEVLASPTAPVQSEQIGRLVPVYSLTEGLTQEKLSKLIRSLLPHIGHWPDPLPPALREKLKVPGWHQALCTVHSPPGRTELIAARHRLVFDEFLLLQLALQQRRAKLKAKQAEQLVIMPDSKHGLVEAFLGQVPFNLTKAQQRVLGEILADMQKEQPMARLLQGDVGCGKTLVAVGAMLAAVDSGCQAALMAPTQVLAEQHFRKLAQWLTYLYLYLLHVTGGGTTLPQARAMVLAEQHFRKLAQWLTSLGVTVDLLTGATPAGQRRELLARLVSGQLDLVVGTHALIEEPVEFARLGLVVVDEQHKFGVQQRNKLLAKGQRQPHLLSMTATPIPRTLTLSIYGDLDLSQIDEMPPGRVPVLTSSLPGQNRKQAYQTIRREVERGQRAYVVLPMVEESEKLELNSAIETHRTLSQNVFPDLNVGLLHGRLSSEEKVAVIQAFAQGDTNVLVSTTVIEVGVDVPEASVMVIEHADRFGLAQLHQLRGRVGRGSEASYCLLINDSKSALAKQRLDLLVKSNDGFEIAEMDLRLRGPGQVLGVRQSGLPDLALASLSHDGEVLELARDVAAALLLADPTLKSYPSLRRALEEQQQRQLAAARLDAAALN